MSIKSFDGEYRFLSNFYPCRVRDKFGLWYNSTEAAYQAAKSNDVLERVAFTDLTDPSAAKKMGRKLTLRADWDTIKLDVMRKLIKQKFASGSALAQRLIATGDEELIEGNWWGDKFWGVFKGQGENHLGKLLMERRKEIIDELVPRDRYH